MPRTIRLIVSIDTEEDNWQPRRDGVTIENIRELPRLDGLFQRLGVRATYFTSHQVAVQEWGAATLRQLQDGGAEIGAHLHPWNSPPLDEPFTPRNCMLCNLPPELQLAKLERLTATLQEAIGARPLAFRAGRYGLGPDTTTALIQCGYQVDSSVTPFVSWEAIDDGPTFVGAPLQMYRLGGRADVRIPNPDGPLLEIPLSTGYNRTPFRVWDGLYRMLAPRAPLSLHLRGIASRLGLVRRILLSPETHSVDDMLTLSRQLIAEGLGHLQLYLHSPSLRPGLTPFAPGPAEVEGIYRAIATFVERLGRLTSLAFVTISEAAAELQSAGSADESVARAAPASLR